MSLGEEVHSEAEWTWPRPDCPHPEWWTSPDIQGTEYEVVEMVHGLIRGLQPEVVIETGSHRGFNSRSIGQALQKNGHGHLWTLEVDEDLHLETKERVEGLPVTALQKSSLDFVPPGFVDFAWLDSLINLRLPEFLRYAPWMHRNSVVAFHDTAIHHGPWSDAIRAHPRLQGFDMPTPRGVWLGRYRP